MQISVQEFFQKLAWQQLKNTAATDDSDTGELNPGHEDQLLSLLNQGLRDITGRKKLITRDDTITFVDGTNTYVMNGGQAADLFLRVIEIQAVPAGMDVITENKKIFLPKTTRHITMPNYYTLKFTDEFMEDYAPSVGVVSQVHHPVITDITTDWIELPPKMQEALALYVSGLYLSQMGGKENSDKGDQYYGLYLKMMTDDDLDNTSQTSEITDNDTRFSDRGFV